MLSAAAAVLGGLLSMAGFQASVAKRGAKGGEKGDDERKGADRADNSGARDERARPEDCGDDRQERVAARANENAEGDRQGSGDGGKGDGAKRSGDGDGKADGKKASDCDPEPEKRSAALAAQEADANTSAGGGDGLRQSLQDRVDRLREKAPNRGDGGTDDDGGGTDDGLVVDIDPSEGTIAVDTSSISYRSGPDGMTVETSNISFSSGPPATPTAPGDGADGDSDFDFDFES